MEPIVRDAKDFLPVNRKRLFWGNLEGMEKPFRKPAALLYKSLEDILSPSRLAVVNRIPTLTTTHHSQRAGEYAAPLLATFVCLWLSN